MRKHRCCQLFGCLAAGVWLIALGAIGTGRAAEGSAIGSLVGSDFADRSSESWHFAFGLDFAGVVQLGRAWDVRGDTGARWYEGADHEVASPDDSPRWGGRAGEFTEGLRAIPTTLDLVYRIESLSQGRFWVPYLGAGFGLYDLQATFRAPDGTERRHTLFRSGWNARAGVQLQRTSGLFINFDTAVHAVDVPGRWASLYDLSVGVGTQLPRR